MDKIRLSEAREEVKEITSGICDSTRLNQLINEAQRRLCRRGKWVGNVQRYRIAATSGLITWPRQVVTPEAIAFCNVPGTIRNGWYEFLGHGPGLLESNSGTWNQAVDRGTACVVNDITPGATDRKVRIYRDVAADDGEVVTVQGYDENSNWIKTLVGSEWIDGEQITVSDGGLSSKKFTRITGIIKPATDGAIRLYEYDTTEAENIQLLGYYEADEINPIYRRTLLPGILDTAVCCNTESRYVTAAVVLKHTPATKDNDWLMLGNIDATKLAVQAILKERMNLQGEAEGYWGKALTELEHELRQFHGDGPIAQPRIQSSEEWGGGIPTLI